MLSLLLCNAFETPLGRTTLSFQIKKTRYLQSFGDLASANNPPKPSLTVPVRQHTASESGDSFFGQSDSLVAISTDGL